MTTLVLAIGTRIYSDGLAAVLSSRHGMFIDATAHDTVGAIVAIETHQPELLLVDVAMKGALELVSLARKRSSMTKVIALALRAGDDDELLKWAEAGAHGFVTCSNSVDELVTCINAALNGELACSPRTSAILLQRVAHCATERVSAKDALHLTPRQTRILQFLGSGLSNKQIARELGIELATVKNHVHHLLRRLGVQRRYEAAACVPQYLYNLDRRTP